MQKVKLPKTLDPKRAAQQRSEYAGIYEVKDLKRLAQSCLAVDKEAEVTVSFDIDPQGRYFFEGDVHSVVMLECQRCGQSFEYALSSHFCFTPVRVDKMGDEDEQLPDAYDPVVLDAIGEIDLLSVIEDELILSLPVVPRHEEQDCPRTSEPMSWGEIDEKAEKPNPFEVLSQLKNTLKK